MSDLILTVQPLVRYYDSLDEEKSVKSGTELIAKLLYLYLIFTSWQLLDFVR